MTTYYRKSEIAQMLSEFGVSVSIGASVSIGIVDRTTDEILQGASAHALGDRIEVTIETGSLVGLEEGASVIVDGATYVVDCVRQVDDGALTQFECKTP